MANMSAAQIRAKLDHPLIDGDSHIIEFKPVLMDFLKEAGGEQMAASVGPRLSSFFSGNDKKKNWYDMTWEERRERRTMRGPWWALPTKNTLDRCTAMIPRMYYERMEDFGLDFLVLYPTLGLAFPHENDDEVRQAACHAYNEFAAANYGEYADRMTMAATIPLHTPEEGIRELEHAKSLGLKVAMIPSYVRRPVPSIAKEYPKLARKVTWMDSYGIDSDYDYDPFWAKCEELGFACAAHSGGMGFDDRRSISNYMYNHMGHFAAGGEVLAKSLLMGGVTKRFPKLRVVLLEGGVVNGTRMYSDILARWSKRSLERVENMNPANIDVAQARQLFEKNANDAIRGKLDQLEEALGVGGAMEAMRTGKGDSSLEIPRELRDDFEHMGIEKATDLRDRFIPHFYFGCESDDPLAPIAFDRRLNPFDQQVRAIMSCDLGHWDVTDMEECAAEAYELVEKGLLTDDDFRRFGFSNSVELYAGANPDFFKGTAIEAQAQQELTQHAHNG